MGAVFSNPNRERGMLSENLGGGPMGLGDPDDKSLRKAEKEIVIPQKMKAKAKKEQCAEQVKEFGICAKEAGLLLPFKCRKQAKQMHICLSTAYADQAFIDECTQEYLKERSEYRRTGVKQKMKKSEGVMI
ncbi:COX assembly mitochondrial protein homolog [Haliotis asinina]|uniref:COX assembly mitochondrial protein homolog n=1 Tax=Haliotis asinina TaxID=109174 RepID=UPI0035323293